MIVVYRCEDKDGVGPYINTPYENRPFWMIDHNDRNNHPSPWAEWGYHPRLEEYKFGFLTQKALREWFSPNTIPWLSNNGYKFYAYEVDEYTLLSGKFQLAFKSETAKKIGEISYEERMEHADLDIA